MCFLSILYLIYWVKTETFSLILLAGHRQPMIGRKYVILGEIQDDTLFIQQIKEYRWHDRYYSHLLQIHLISWFYNLPDMAIFRIFLMACNQVVLQHQENNLDVIIRM